MVGHQYIFVAFSGCDRKPSCLVSVKFTCQIHCLEEDKIGASECGYGGNWSGSGSGSGSGSDWSSFFCADRRPLLGC